MSEWKVHLVYTDAKSNKFWRARTDGGTLYVNYGRVGSDGQTSVKEFGSLVEADAALDKQAASKRKKGYVDEEGGGEAEAEAAAPSGPQRVELTLDAGGRQVQVVLSSDGAAVRTEVVEHYSSPAEAAAAFERIHQAMAAEGYRAK